MLPPQKAGTLTSLPKTEDDLKAKMNPVGQVLKAESANPKTPDEKTSRNEADLAAFKQKALSKPEEDKTDKTKEKDTANQVKAGGQAQQPLQKLANGAAQQPQAGAKPAPSSFQASSFTKNNKKLIRIHSRWNEEEQRYKNTKEYEDGTMEDDDTMSQPNLPPAELKGAKSKLESPEKSLSLTEGQADVPNPTMLKPVQPINPAAAKKSDDLMKASHIVANDFRNTQRVENNPARQQNNLYTLTVYPDDSPPVFIMRFKRPAPSSKYGPMGGIVYRDDPRLLSLYHNLVEEPTIEDARSEYRTSYIIKRSFIDDNHKSMKVSPFKKH